MKKQHPDPNMNELRGRFLDMLQASASQFEWEITQEGLIRAMADGHIFDPITAVLYHFQKEYVPYCGLGYELDGYYSVFAAAKRLAILEVSEEIVKAADFPTVEPSSMAGRLRADMIRFCDLDEDALCGGKKKIKKKAA